LARLLQSLACISVSQGLAVSIQESVTDLEPAANAAEFSFALARSTATPFRTNAPSQVFLKRALDLLTAVPLLVLCAPVFLVIALLVRLDSKGPALFRQTRLGRNGEPFNIVKFRTMNVLEDGDEVVQAVRNDPRVTRVGRWLRKSSLDELPQLWNVICGQMSLVGPRPHARAHDQLYAILIENYELRQLVKPGITGWAQVNGHRGETPTLEAMHRRVEFDIWYARHGNAWLDIRILLRTPFEMLSSRNAY
jgi:putative colanic acid biosynthesis UDP-glucose lipid carrier transferase